MSMKVQNVEQLKTTITSSKPDTVIHADIPARLVVESTLLGTESFEYMMKYTMMVHV